MDKLTRRKYFLQYFERCEDCFQFLHIHLFSPAKNNLVTADKQNKRLTKTVLQVVIDVEILADRLFSMTLVQPPSLSRAANRMIHLSSK